MSDEPKKMAIEESLPSNVSRLLSVVELETGLTRDEILSSKDVFYQRATDKVCSKPHPHRLGLWQRKEQKTGLWAKLTGK